MATSGRQGSEAALPDPTGDDGALAFWLRGAPDVPDGARVYAAQNVPTAAPQDTAGQVRTAMLGVRYESCDDVAVCLGDRLCGVVRLEDLLAADEDASLSDLMDPCPPVLPPDADRERAAWEAAHHGESAIAVVDAQGRFQGLIPPWRMVDVLLRELQEDQARLSGFLHDAETARTASAEPVGRRFWHRLPWLLLGLAGALLAARIVGSYESLLTGNVVLAFFIPGIVYMADAVGTQTETLVIRGLSVGVPIGAVAKRELVTGLLIGVAMGAAFLPLGLLLWDDTLVVMAVGLALFAACSTATVVAMVLPWLIHRFGADPAFGSGPAATVVQDLLSILIYFAVVLAVAGG